MVVSKNREADQADKSDQAGQAVAEFAAVFPVLLLFLLLFMEIGVVLLQQLALESVAREGARAAAVSDSAVEITAAARGASDLDDNRLSIDIGPRPEAGNLVRVSATYEAKVVEPLTGTVLFRPELRASAAMRVESPLR